MFINRKPTMTLAVIVAVLGTLCGSSAAFAASPSTDTKPPATQVGMYMAGFDAAAAKAHGYKIVTYPNGDQQSVPADPRSTLPKSAVLHPNGARNTTLKSALQSQQTATVVAPSPSTQAAPANTDYNEVWGNCGRAWIRVAQTGTNKVGIVSGFSNTPETAYYWIWNVSLSDVNGTSIQSYEHAIFDDKATHVWSNLNQYGYTFDYIYSGGATLIDGTICLAGHPDVSISL